MVGCRWQIAVSYVRYPDISIYKEYTKTNYYRLFASYLVGKLLTTFAARRVGFDR